MKKILLICLILILPGMAYGATGDVASVNGVAVTGISTIGGATGSGIATICGKNYTDGDAASCQESAKESYETTGTYESLGNAADGTKNWQAVMVTAGASYLLCKFGWSLKKTGSPTFTITTYVYDNNTSPSDRPGNLLYSMTSSAINAADLTGSYVWYYPTFNNESISSGTKYWFVAKASAAGDTSNYVRIQSSTTDGRTAYSTNGLSWSIVTADTVMFRTYSYE